MEDKLERYMDFAGAVPPCVTPARLEQLAARRRQRLQLRLGMAAAVLWVLAFAAGMVLLACWLPDARLLLAEGIAVLGMGIAAAAAVLLLLPNHKRRYEVWQS